MRDFFYNKGDVFIAILIIIIAAFVIYVRVGVIMDYSASGNSSGGLLPMPPGIGNADNGQSGGDANANIDTGAGAGADSGAAVDQSGQDGQTAQAGDSTAQSPAAPQTPDVATDSNQPAQTATPPAQQPGSSPVQITVSAGDAASTIADKLLTAGAISDKQAFIAEVLAEGADSKLKMGTFTIPAGSSYADIIKILVG